MVQVATKREQLREERRRQILDAALVVFSRKGYHGANVSDVAAQAGVSQGTIYWYFDSKEELLRQLMAEVFEDMFVPFVEALADTVAPPLERIRKAVRVSLAILDESAERLRLMINLWSQPELFNPGSEESGLMAQAYEDGVLDPLRRLIREAMDVRDIPPGDAKALAVAVGAMMEGLMLYAVLWPEGKVTPAQLEDVVIERFLRLEA